VLRKELAVFGSAIRDLGVFETFHEALELAFFFTMRSSSGGCIAVGHNSSSQVGLLLSLRALPRELRDIERVGGRALSAPKIFVVEWRGRIPTCCHPNAGVPVAVIEPPMVGTAILSCRHFFLLCAWILYCSPHIRGSHVWE
jgi:hypothetical protein